MTLRNFFICLFIVSLFSCETNSNKDYKIIEISKEKYADQLYGFWLGQLIANWTGLITEMDKIGNIGEVKTGEFYTRNDWGKTDQRSIWEDESVSKSEVKIDYVFRDKDEVWGSDDDTDIEYMYQYLLNFYETSILTPCQIRAGWLKHIKKEEENYLWVSNQKAYDLMNSGILPPETSSPNLNPHYEMIDAQLTTEIFGLYSPLNPEYALLMSSLPIRTVARENAEWISQFYIIMHSLSYFDKDEIQIKDKIFLCNDRKDIIEKRINELTAMRTNLFKKMKSMGNVRLPGERRHKNRLDKGPRNINEELVNKIKSLS